MKKNRLHIAVICIIMSLSFPILLFAQSNISGIINSTDSIPIGGATISIQGSVVKETKTNKEGKFNIQAKEGDVINVAATGYLKYSMILNSVSDPLFIYLTSETNKLSDVIVIGYGSIKQKDLTGAVASVQSKDLVTAGVNSVDKALQGKLAGVQIEAASGAPGTGMSVLVRGVGTINNTNPLYIVDGMYVSSISNLMPGDIASISVLKDASAAAIYGSRAANGVVIVTTKSGSSGKTTIGVNAYYGIQKIGKKLDVLNATEWGQVNNTMHDNAGVARLPLANNPDSLGPSTDWQDAIYRSAPMQSYELNITGGGNGSNYSVSGGYYNQQGIVDVTSYKRYNLRVKSETRKGIFRFGETFLFSQENKVNFSGGWGGQGGNPVGAAAKSIPAFQIYDPSAIGGYAGATGSVINVENPVAMLHLEHTTTRINSILINAYAQADLMKGLYYKFNVGYIDNQQHDFDYVQRHQVGTFFNVATNNINTDANTNSTTVLLENTLNFDRDFGKHHFQALVGYTYQDYKQRYTNQTALNVPDGLEEVSAALGTRNAFGTSTESVLISQLGRIIYTYDNRFLFTGSIRRDGSSRFAPDNRQGVYPSLAVGWNISNERFFAESKVGHFINSLKLRGSYGTLGNQEFTDYQFKPVITSNINYVYGTGQTLWSGATQQSFANPNIKWESSKTSDIGIDMTFWNNHFSLTADYYYKKTSDMLVQVPIPGSAGSTSSPYVNAGSISNRGFELSLAYHGDINKLSYNIFGNLSTNTNKVLALGSGSQQIIGGIAGLNTGGTTTTQVGGPVGAFYLVKAEGIFQTQAEVDAYTDNSGNKILPNAKPGDIKFEDKNGDGIISDLDKQYFGSSTPKMTYGMGFNANYNGFDMSVYFQGVEGNKIYNGFRMNMEGMNIDYNQLKTTLNAWTPTNTNTDIPRAVYGDPNSNDRISSRFLESGAYLRCKSVQLGYSVKAKPLTNIGISTLRAYISFDNLFTITKYSGFNPDLGVVSGQNIFSRGVDYSYTSYPLARTSTLGIQVTF